MSKVVTAHWKCDQCMESGGSVDEHETLPHGWLSIAMLCGSPQLRSESAVDRHAHLCGACSHRFLFHTLIGDSVELTRLRSIYSRPPLVDTAKVFDGSALSTKAVKP